MIKNLIKLATHLDRRGLRKEADYLDSVIRKYSEQGWSGHGTGDAGGQYRPPPGIPAVPGQRHTPPQNPGGHTMTPRDSHGRPSNTVFGRIEITPAMQREVNKKKIVVLNHRDNFWTAIVQVGTGRILAYYDNAENVAITDGTDYTNNLFDEVTAISNRKIEPGTMASPNSKDELMPVGQMLSNRDGAWKPATSPKQMTRAERGAENGARSSAFGLRNNLDDLWDK